MADTSLEEAHLCVRCLDILQTRQLAESLSQNNHVYAHHCTSKSLLASVAQNCRLCTIFWLKQTTEAHNALLLEDNEEGSPLTALMYGSFGTSFGSPRFNLWVGVHDQALGKFNEKFSMANFSLLPVPSTEEEIASSANAGSSTVSTESWQVAQSWIKQCVAEHPQCNQDQESAWRPSRLLYFTTADPTIRLVQSSEETITGSYVTLSHRWPSKMPLALTKQSMHSLQSGIAVSALPQAFQDAVSICRRLSVQYLWIDSLCIMQDADLEDWLKEAPLMHKVYSNAYLNISSLGAKDCTNSFFRDRNPSFVAKMRVQVAMYAKARSKTHEPGAATTTTGLYKVVDDGIWEREVNNAALNNRAWVMQERILAPRVLHFAATQLFWECRQLMASEASPEGNVPKNNLKALNAPQTPESRDVYQAWDEIVDRYCSCGLTVSGDKLIALAGIANALAMQTGHESLAGLWRQRLAHNLAWYMPAGNLADVDTMSCSEPGRYRAPSFSWASREGRVWSGGWLYGDAPSDRLVKLETWELRLVGEDPMGMVRGGYIELSCRLKKLRVEPGRNEDEHHRLLIDQCEVAGLYNAYLDDHPRCFEPVGRTDLFCAALRKHEENSEGLGDYNFDSDVMLLHCVDEVQGRFRRFGLLKVTGEYNVYIASAQVPADPTYPCRYRTQNRHVIRVI